MNIIKLEMKFIVAICAILITGIATSQVPKVKVYLDETQLYTPEEGNYYQVQLLFEGPSLQYVTKDSSVFAELQITQLFSQNDTIVQSDRYNLSSPEVKDSAVLNFYDIQRYVLSPGTYDYSLIIQDLNSEQEPISLDKEIEIKPYKNEIRTSFMAAETIQVTDGEQNLFSQFGYDVTPMMSNYYPSEFNVLPYYLEVYNTSLYLDDSVYIVQEKLINNSNELDMEPYIRYYRYQDTPIQPIAKYVNISELPTGSYTLELNVLDRNKIVLARSSYDFERSNSKEIDNVAFEVAILNPNFDSSIPMDSTDYYVASLIPIAQQTEVRNILNLLKKNDSILNKKYIQAFWQVSAPSHPYEGWMRYKAEVKNIERLFATNYQDGFETDRGRVYLAYGPPSSIIERPSSPSEYPYEIWQYDKINRFRNRRFIFYSSTNLGNDYKLLHSDMRGELQNYRWKYELNRRNTPGAGLDDPSGGAIDHFGGNSSRYYRSY